MKLKLNIKFIKIPHILNEFAVFLRRNSNMRWSNLSKKLSEIIKELEDKGCIKEYYLHHQYYIGEFEFNIEFHNDISDEILENNVEKIEGSCAYWE